MLANPDAQHHMRIAESMAQAAPNLYQVASVHRRDNEQERTSVDSKA